MASWLKFSSIFSSCGWWSWIGDNYNTKVAHT